MCAANGRRNLARQALEWEGGRRTWEAKHGEITSSAVACCSKLHRICSVGLQLLDRLDFFSPTEFGIESDALTLNGFEGPQVRERSGCLVGTQWLPVFSQVGGARRDCQQRMDEDAKFIVVWGEKDCLAR